VSSEEVGAGLSGRAGAATAGTSNVSESVTVLIREEDCVGEPGYTADITFRWHTAPAGAGIGDGDRVVAELLAERAAHLIRQERLSAAQLRGTERSLNLSEALASNRHVGQALGSLMCTYKLTSEQAFDLLRGVSQHTHRKLRDIADNVNLTGTLTVASSSTRAATSASAPRSGLRVAGDYA
jgi:hypothetical protein